MRIYLCARYSRRDQMRMVRTILGDAGHEVISRWLDTDWEPAEPRSSSAAPPEYREKYALIDMEDVESCDAILTITEAPDGCGRGGRHVEFGMAVAWGKKLFVIGYRENVFHHLPRVQFFPWTEGLLSNKVQEVIAAMGNVQQQDNQCYECRRWFLPLEQYEEGCEPVYTRNDKGRIRLCRVCYMQGGGWK